MLASNSFLDNMHEAYTSLYRLQIDVLSNPIETPKCTLHEKSNGALDVVFDALRSQNLGKHPEMAIA